MTQLPPFSLEAEAAVISAAVLDDHGASLDAARAILAAEAFYKRENRLIFEAMCKLSDAGQPTDTVTIWSQLCADKINGIDVAYLAQVIDQTPSIGNIAGHARIVQDCHLLRQAIAAAQRISAEGYGFSGVSSERVQKFLRGAEQDFSDLVLLRQGRRLRAVSEVLVEVSRTLTAAFERKSAITGQATGFTALDRMTTGLHAGDLYILAARPGMGKTAFALNLAVELARGGDAVAVFSLEMPAEQLVLRLLSAESGVELSKLRTGCFDPGLWPRLSEAMQLLASVPLFVDDSVGITIFDVRARVRSLQNELEAGRHPSCSSGRIGLCEVDYAQLMAPHKSCRNREEEIASISSESKRTAKQLDVPMLLLSQLNREVEKRPDKRPRLSDLRESGALEQDADGVFFLFRPGYYDKDNEELRGQAECIVAKQRNGPTGSVPLRYVDHVTRFYNLEPGDDYDGWDRPDPAIDTARIDVYG